MCTPRNLLGILLILLLTACGTPQSAQVAGTWIGELTTLGTELNLTLIQTETTVTGSATLGTLEFGVGGSVLGNDLSLTYTEREESISLNGRVSDDRFSGVITTASNGEVTVTGDFVLERQPEGAE